VRDLPAPQGAARLVDHIEYRGHCFRRRHVVDYFFTAIPAALVSSVVFA